MNEHLHNGTPSELLYRFHPDKGWQYWGVYGWTWSSHNATGSTGSFFPSNVIPWVLTWAEPEEDEL